MPTRQKMWNQLGEDVDVLIVGGGINGAGIARDAARRGLRVALCEMNDLASGTSSRSSKLVHGGLRYLEQFEFALVFESVSERRVLLDIAPHLVNPLGFLFPVYKGKGKGLALINTGMWLYDGLSLFRSPKKRRTLYEKQLRDEEPALTVEGISGAPLYYDCSTDDARLTLESALDAYMLDATVATYSRVVEFLKEDGRITGAVVECTLTGERKDVRAGVVVNATGPWTDRTLETSKPQSQKLLRPTKGVHIVVAREVLPVNHAVVCIHPEDGRVLFAIPWGDMTYVGTTDTDFDGDPAHVYTDSDDVTYLIRAAESYFPGHPIRPEDIVSTWAGLRPLITEGDKGSAEEVDESSVSREHQILVSDEGLVTVAGGKLTTYRLMSKQVVEKAIEQLVRTGQLRRQITLPRTEQTPLPGAVGWPEDDDHEAMIDRVIKQSEGTLEKDSASLLANTYGTRALELARWIAEHPSYRERLIEGRPEVVGQVFWSVRKEMAATIMDVLKNRTQIYYRAKDQGLECVERVGDLMAKQLAWSDDVRVRMIDAYREEVRLSRAWREGFDIPVMSAPA